MQDDVAWNNLISWLHSKGMNTAPDHLLVYSKWDPERGRGLFTTQDVAPNTPLFTVPNSANMNIETLAPVYGPRCANMTATQLISMHLFLQRTGLGGKNNISNFSDFDPYISILPADFDAHPLSWMISSKKCSPVVTFLLGALPPAVSSALNAMTHRFWGDWKVVSEFMNHHSNILLESVALTSMPDYHIKTYLWAWLNVNTRCVYHRIACSTSEANNLTLCPILDLANHTSSPTFTPLTNPIPTFMSPSSRMLKKGDEMLLRYGSHSNVTLFTEYGFVEPSSENGGQVDVQDIMETLFRSTDVAVGQWMRSTLESANYWGDWKLFNTPTPAHPSYRLLPALRLMKLSNASDTTVVAMSSELDIWEKTLIGELDIVSPENEERVWEQLSDICKIISRRAEEAIRRLEHWHETQTGELLGWEKYAIHAIKTLWLEERGVSQAVMQSIRDDENIS